MASRHITYSLVDIIKAMRERKYFGVQDHNGKVHVGLVNSLMAEDGSGKNWIVTVSHNLKTEKVFIHAN
jgi:hypothetical protein